MDFPVSRAQHHQHSVLLRLNSDRPGLVGATNHSDFPASPHFSELKTSCLLRNSVNRRDQTRASSLHQGRRKQNCDGSVFHPGDSHSSCCSRPSAYNRVQQPRAKSLDETISTHSAKCDVPNGIRRFVEHEVRRERGASLSDSCSELVQANY